MRQTLLALYRAEVPDLDRARLARHTPDIGPADIAEELIVAFGAAGGAGRQARKGASNCGDRPLHISPSACMARWSRLLHGCSFGIQLHGYAFVAPLPPSQDEAQIIALELCRGRCQCWRLRHPDAVQPDDRHAQKRADRCLREHRLAAWNPASMSLWNFLARAVKGDKPQRSPRSKQGKKSIAPAAFACSMFFCSLYRDHHVRFGNVLGWRCERHPTVLYEGLECFECKAEEYSTLFDESVHHRGVKKRLLVAAPTGRYAEAEYWRCQTCKSYYAKDHNLCPKCQHRRGPGAAKSTVWVRGAPRMQGGQEPAGEQVVHRAIAKLPAKLRNIVEILLDGMSPSEIARRLTCPMHEIEAAIDEARQLLKALMENDMDDTES